MATPEQTPAEELAEDFTTRLDRYAAQHDIPAIVAAVHERYGPHVRSADEIPDNQWYSIAQEFEK